MKKLSGLLLMLLLVFGVSSGVSAATYTSITDWDGYKEPQLQLTLNPALATGGGDLDYNYGDKYSFYEILYSDLDFSYRWMPVHVKIYRVDPNNCNSSGCTLQRYKTINAELLDSWTEENNVVANQYRYETTITTGFPAGRYYAVLTNKKVYWDGSSPSYYAERSYRFTID
ncbi:DUF5065 family protein [Cytobacillus firmus]